MNYAMAVCLGVISSIFSVLLIGLYVKVKSFCRLKSFLGFYQEVGNLNIKYKLTFPMTNFFKIDERLILENISGNPWKSELIINNNSPFHTEGIFNYPDKRWGYQKLYFNKKDLVIYVISDFSPYGTSESNKYSLIKMNYLA